jgi:hypothetical protein
LPRVALLYMQQFGLWGWTALVLSLWAFFGRGGHIAAVAAVAFGVGGAINYNVDLGVLGIVIGGWAWLRPPNQTPRAIATAIVRP